jgi:hypothetical protein
VKAALSIDPSAAVVVRSSSRSATAMRASSWSATAVSATAPVWAAAAFVGVRGCPPHRPPLALPPSPARRGLRRRYRQQRWSC